VHSIRVLAFTCSRDRPFFLRNCILQMKVQTYPVDHTVYLNGTADMRPLYGDLVGPRLFLHFGPTKSQHENHLEAIRRVAHRDYDVFCKIDDDDVYRADYIEGVVSDFEANSWDYSGAASDGFIKGGRWFPKMRVASLGLAPEDRDIGVVEVMPPTAAFSRAAIARILALPDTGAWTEDIAWRRELARSGAVQRVRSRSSFVYHVHGRNLSMGHRIGDDEVGA
jgi:hypothetical protein